jgi:hypothetical protein
MPCTLIELFFIDNAGDGAKLATDSFRSIVSEGLAQGLTRFAGGEPLTVEPLISKPKRMTRKGKKK